MSDAIDLLQCPTCGAFYVPTFTVTGRLRQHCLSFDPGPSHEPLLEREPIEVDYSSTEARVVKWYNGEAHVDFEGAYRRRVERYLLTGDVVGPPLTGTILDTKV